MPDPQRRSYVEFSISPAMVAEIENIIDTTGLSSPPEVFRRALSILQIHVDAAAHGRKVYVVGSKHPDDMGIVTLPFNVRQTTEETN